MNTSLTESSSIRILGLMTGSSADGLDLCLVEFKGLGSSPDYKVIYSNEISYPDIFKTTFRNPLALSNTDIADMDHMLGDWLAHEIDKLDLTFDIIASHGQTIKHDPPNFSLQIGDPHYMADLLKVPVIYDFRNADIRQNGQGAPLIPIVDRLLFQQEYNDVLALNIGGIANITVIPASNSLGQLLAWDTGPGNTLIDKAVQLYSAGQLNYDPEGSIASEGKLNSDLLKLMLSHEFYDRTPPRSAGQEQFGEIYFNTLLDMFYPKTDQEFKDLIFTFTLLTAKTIANSVVSLTEKYKPKILYVSGGGCLNKTLLKLLNNELPDLELKQVNANGIDAGNKEAFGFAYLGYLYHRDLPGNLPSVTGAQQAIVLGEICYPR